jgi:cysteine-rich repeat protein
MRLLLFYASGLLLLFSLGAPAAIADFHKWEISEVFTNADGTVQFIEFFTDDPDPQHLMASEETVSIVTNSQTFVFPTDLPGPKVGNRWMLIGTPAFAALPGAPTPNYTIPANFFSTSSGVLIEYTDEGGEIDSDSPSPLPTDGILSWNRALSLTNSPTNYAGTTGSVNASGGGAVCGNSVLEAGEDCDDGNTAGGDCCTPTCAFEFSGSSCNDADACTAGDSCDGAGTCQAGSPLVCDDTNACTDDSCNTASGCVFTNNTAACDDGSACTTCDW